MEGLGNYMRHILFLNCHSFEYWTKPSLLNFGDITRIAAFSVTFPWTGYCYKRRRRRRRGGGGGGGGVVKKKILYFLIYFLGVGNVIFKPKLEKDFCWSVETLSEKRTCVLSPESKGGFSVLFLFCFAFFFFIPLYIYIDHIYHQKPYFTSPMSYSSRPFQLSRSSRIASPVWFY